MSVVTGLAPLPGARDARDPQRAIKRGPSRVPREQVAATQRDRLYDGLVRTVAEQGYANASVSDICRASGVTRPAFYEHFESKQGAFLAAYRHGTDVLFAMLRNAFTQAQAELCAEPGAAGRDEAARLAGWARTTTAVLAVLLDVLSSVPAFATAAIVEIDAVGPAGRRARGDRLRDFEAFFAPAPATPPAADRDELVGSVVAGAYGTLHRHIAEGRIAELPRLLPSLVYFVVAPFAGPGLAARAAAEAAEGLRAGADHQRSVAPCVPAQAGAGEAGVTGA
ncbi:MAG: helix-turn-helix transcriptional regulator [Catenulispora sp.]|nr:helix-turn-helix transcriptional regulator [Catenulispora sp.]